MLFVGRHGVLDRPASRILQPKHETAGVTFMFAPPHLIGSEFFAIDHGGNGREGERHGGREGGRSGGKKTGRRQRKVDRKEQGYMGGY